MAFSSQDLFQLGHAGLEPTLLDVVPAIQESSRQQQPAQLPTAFQERVAVAASFEFSNDDPLGHVLLANFGGYPPIQESGTDYAEIVATNLGAHTIPKHTPLPRGVQTLWTAIRINRFGLTENTRLRAEGVDGVFAGAKDSFDDLVTFWNVRALGADVQFIDPREERLRCLATGWKTDESSKSRKQEFDSPLGMWCYEWTEIASSVAETLGQSAYQRVASEDWWSRIPVFAAPCAPKSYALPTITTSGRAELTFQLPDLPFESDHSRHIPLLAISVEPMGDFVGTSDLTIWTPHIPVLNDFYSDLYRSRNSVRSTPDGFVVIIHDVTRILTLFPLSRLKLLKAIFAAFGITATQSDAGRVTARLISQMGSVLACAVFKPRGVRRLISRNSPLKAFTRGAATMLIHNESGLTEHDTIASLDDVHLGNHRLTADAAFDFLLSRGVFRVGLELQCPHCTLKFWIAVDDLRSVATCEYCGEDFLIAMQLKDRDWRYRRSGLFGNDDSQHGGIPVALTIHQLTEGIHIMRLSAFSPGMLLSLREGLSCESDFVLLVEEEGETKSLQLVIGECKSEGGQVTQEDVNNMKAIAESFPAHQIRVFIVFSKTGDFSKEEIDHCRTAQTDPPRVILFSRRELEPTFVYMRAAKEFEIQGVAISLEGLARNTVDIFFDPKPRKAAT